MGVRVAVVHDWLTGMRGGEWCLEAFLLMYPEADVFTLIHIPNSTTKRIDSRIKCTSWLSRLPGIKKYYRALLPLFPFVIRSFDFTGYDHVISINHAAVKNIRIPAGCRHTCYCLTPMRYIWDQAAEYLHGLLPVVWPLILLLRKWDVNGSRSVDTFIGISKFVGARIRRFYHRKSSVAYPPVAVEWLWPRRPKPYEANYFLTAGALVPYKRTELAVQAATRAGLQLVVAGGGPELEPLKTIAGPTVIFEGRVSDDRLAALYQHCTAFLFLAEEDFGIMPVEALASGSPVIARYLGAARETINAFRPWKDALGAAGVKSFTGVFMRRAESGTADEVSSLIEAMQLSAERRNEFDRDQLRTEAEKYSPAQFFRSWVRSIDPTLNPSVNEATFVTAFEKSRLRLE